MIDINDYVSQLSTLADILHDRTQNVDTVSVSKVKQLQESLDNMQFVLDRISDEVYRRERE